MSAEIKPLVLKKTATHINPHYIDLLGHPWSLSVTSVGVEFSSQDRLATNELVLLCVNLCESAAVEEYPQRTDLTPLCQFKLNYGDGVFFHRVDSRFFPVTRKRQDVTIHLITKDGHDLCTEIFGDIQVMCNFKRVTF